MVIKTERLGIAGHAEGQNVLDFFEQSAGEHLPAALVEDRVQFGAGWKQPELEDAEAF